MKYACEAKNKKKVSKAKVVEAIVTNELLRVEVEENATFMTTTNGMRKNKDFDFEKK